LVVVKQGVAIGDACKRSGVANIILSSHLHVENTIGVPAKHYDAKAEIYSYIRLVSQGAQLTFLTA